MTWVRVCRADELSASAALAVQVAGHALCLALADGAPVAVEDRCPHRDVALSGGVVAGGVVTCPGHFRRFDLRSGRCLSVPGERARRYDLTVADGWVLADLGAAPPRRSIREVLLAHARGQVR